MQLPEMHRTGRVNFITTRFCQKQISFFLYCLEMLLSKLEISISIVSIVYLNARNQLESLNQLFRKKLPEDLRTKLIAS